MIRYAAIACAAVLVCAASLAIAQPHFKAGQNLTSAPPITRLAWTASDQPYKAVAAKIGSEHEAGESPQSLTRRYKTAARQQPSVAQFAWVCAARGEAILGNPDGSVPYALIEQLAKSDPGNVHEYTRYRFCMTAEANRILPPAEAERVGEKLLRYDPHDNWVRLSLVNMLCDGGRPSVAMSYALAWTKQEPNNPKAHSSLALVYQD